ncbi:MAG: HAMP domain-containing histidine kinase, partial [Planctomycetes bacterium]|nr:HAMP domain-containing histidine kinase [Planctomycetota bacterium]
IELAGWEFDFPAGSKTFRCGAVPLEESDGRKVGYILSLVDITESVVARNELVAMLITSGFVLVGLLCGFFWGYLGWVQREVADTQAEIEISLKRERSFAGDVAHELRTPLAGMRSTIDVALFCDEQTGEYRESLQDCSSIVEKMESLVDNLFLLARFDREKAANRKATIGLSELIDECWQPLRQQAAKRSLAFENRVSKDLAGISDRVSLSIILSNLLENSVEYADSNGRIWVTGGKDSAGAVYVAIANTGCQLSQAEASMAFQTFWRADASRGSDGKHVGLGLSLARRLARSLGGDASADVNEDGVFAVRVFLDGSSQP